MKEVKWIYYCKPTDAYIYSCDDRWRFESEEEAINGAKKMQRNIVVFHLNILKVVMYH